MKKLIAGIIAAFVMAAGLVTVSGGTSANAAYNQGSTPLVSVPKPVGVGTTPKSATKVARGKSKTIRIKYNAKPGTTATVTVKIGAKVGAPLGTGGTKKKAAKKKARGTVKNVKPGQVIKFKTGKLKKKGTYRVWVTITPKGGKPKTLTYYIKVK